MKLDKKILVSSCLLGKKCRYSGQDAFNSELVKRLKGEQIIDCCPEIMAGLPTPRPSCNIQGGNGLDVLEGRAKVLGNDGKDYTIQFINGAKSALKMALDNNVTRAILKECSPSCGCNKIYSKDGKKLVDGNGVFAALLKKNGIDTESL